MKKIMVMALGLLLVVGCSSNNETAEKKMDTLRVGLECDYAPYNWTTTADKGSKDAVAISGNDTSYCDGYDVVIATRLAKELNMDLEIKQITWDGLIPAVVSNDIDVIIAGMSPTEERKQTIAFSDPYFKSDSDFGVVVRKDSKYANAKSLEDLSGAKITAQMGTFHVELLDQIPNVEKTAALDSFPAMMQATASSAIDGYIAESKVGEEHVESNSDLVFLSFDKGFELKEEHVATSIGASKDNAELIERINTALATISDEERDQIMNEKTEISK